MVQCLYREKFWDAAHFREISSDKKSRVSLIKKASSSAAENVMAIVLGHFQSVCQDLKQSTYDVKRLWVFLPGSGSVCAIAIVSEALWPHKRSYSTSL